ncbi:hypothetical protein PLICRDRAFT_171382 [Plicaturopsis crispa FD-325 SS-3]|nr:hypothetical protein PLICRDRAFT_171382 [Plicaturopsis crispa FD-325 SS-3]
MSYLYPELDVWKKRRFRKDEISLATAADSAKSGKSIVWLKAERGGPRYNLCSVDNYDRRVFTYAAIWNRGTPAQTGNYVRYGDPAPSIPISRIQRLIGYKCVVTYIFDTSEDPSLYEHFTALETLTRAYDVFTNKMRPRRSWQTLSGARFQMSCPLFAKKTPWNESMLKDHRYSYPIHPWIREAAEESTEFIPSLVSPAKFLSYENGEMIPLSDSAYPDLNPGDTVWISMTIAYIAGQKDWFPEINPIEIVRVHRAELASSRGSSNRLTDQDASSVVPLTLGPLPFIDDTDTTLGGQPGDLPKPPPPSSSDTTLGGQPGGSPKPPPPPPPSSPVTESARNGEIDKAVEYDSTIGDSGSSMLDDNALPVDSDVLISDWEATPPPSPTTSDIGSIQETNEYKPSDGEASSEAVINSGAKFRGYRTTETDGNSSDEDLDNIHPRGEKRRATEDTDDEFMVVPSLKRKPNKGKKRGSAR